MKNSLLIILLVTTFYLVVIFMTRVYDFYLGYNKYSNKVGFEKSGKVTVILYYGIFATFFVFDRKIISCRSPPVQSI